MTSNIGFPGSRKRPIGFQVQSTGGEQFPPELKAAFRPELLNRIDRVITFSPLQPDHIADIARLILGSLRKRLAEQKLGLQVSDGAVALLAKLGYDEQYGARPLRRVIEQRLENPLGQMILRNEAREGHIVIIDAHAGEFEIRTIGTETM